MLKAPSISVWRLQINLDVIEPKNNEEQLHGEESTKTEVSCYFVFRDFIYTKAELYSSTHTHRHTV